ncbi:Undecaprenol kinase [bioreactor metagenome]|uniref:Undecaprenol kinase n=1 Tax=bioreactor metagenome TaxID=1076179 RepID=A0A645ASB0_9ZZZZ
MQPKQSLLQAFRNAFHGLKFVVTTQRNAQIHLAITILVIAAAIAFGVSANEWIAIVIAIGFVWATESINTAIEKLTDLASPGYHTLAKYAKDCAAAAVLISALTAVVIGVIIFLPRLLYMFKFF